MRSYLSGIAIGVLAAFSPAHGQENSTATPSALSTPSILEVSSIAKVASGFPVGFCLLTKGKMQFVSYYDSGHNMIVSSRHLGSDKWQHEILPSRVGWDSHNNTTMAIDDDGTIHLAGNMHCSPLVYFRSEKPWDISSLVRQDKMIGRQEGSITYPIFIKGPDQRLIFHYRYGASGNGHEIYNVYDPEAKSWKRFLDRPLIDGKGKRNAYMSGPTLGPDGWFHLAWVWRDSPDCSSNHSPSYAKSRDLLQWNTIEGQPLSLPITIDNSSVVIDAVPKNGGIINGSLNIGFDSKNRPIASYHKFDPAGITQAYVARIENGKWVSRAISNWNYRWDFKGGGSIIFEINIGSIRTHGPGKLALPYDHIKNGRGLIVIDEITLKPVSIEPIKAEYPAELLKTESNFPKMTVQWCGDQGEAIDQASRYVLRWETLPINRDKKPVGPLPEASWLRVYKILMPGSSR